MTTFTSTVVLGEKYLDERTGIQGHANVLVFNENGCVEVELEYVEKTLDGGIERKKEVFNEVRLAPVDGEGGKSEHESDIALGTHYRDVQTGLEGWACAIEFHEKTATRVIIKSVGYDKDGAKVLKYHIIDDFLLQALGADGKPVAKVAERKSDKPSPITREIAR